MHEPEDMIFLMKLLKKNELFVDVGANIGTYSIPISHITQCRSLAIEALPFTYNILNHNIQTNRLSNLVQPLNIGISDTEELLSFTSDLNVSNKVAVSEKSSLVFEQVRCKSLDDVCSEAPTAIKIDVEGFETKVIAGANRTFNDLKLKAIIIELNGHGEKYFGFDENKLHEKILSFGFTSVLYDIKGNKLLAAQGKNKRGNTIYVRDINNINSELSNSTFSIGKYL